MASDRKPWVEDESLFFRDTYIDLPSGEIREYIAKHGLKHLFGRFMFDYDLLGYIADSRFLVYNIGLVVFTSLVDADLSVHDRVIINWDLPCSWEKVIISNYTVPVNLMRYYRLCRLKVPGK